MAKTIFIGGYGPGISNAVAETFGKKGFAVALSGRKREKLEEGVKHLASLGIRAEAFPTDLGDAAAVRKTLSDVREKLGPITILQWTAAAAEAGDLIKATAKEIQSVLDLAIVNLIVAVQEVLPDLRGNREAAVLVTNGGFGLFDANIDAMAVQFGSMGLAIGNAAKHKLVGLLAKKLASENIYVGEVMVNGVVRGTAWDRGNATIDAKSVGAKFWEIYEAKKETFVQVN